MPEYIDKFNNEEKPISSNNNKGLYLNEECTERCKQLLDTAHLYAEGHSGCKKVSVGSVIVDNLHTTHVRVYGANETIPVSCKKEGCLRVQKYGENSKLHRNPEDCRAIHSEVNAISIAARYGLSLEGKTIVVTRYPCEACARAIISSGIKEVVYGRAQNCSDETYKMLRGAGISVIHVQDWDAPDVTY